MTETARFVISRSPVQVWSPAPSSFPCDNRAARRTDCSKSISFSVADSVRAARAVLILLVLLGAAVPASAGNEALILPAKPLPAKFYGVEQVTELTWTRPTQRHTKIAIGVALATIAVDAVATGILLHRIGKAEHRYRVSIVDRKEFIGGKAFGNFLTVAQLFAQARRAPKTTTASAAITAAANAWSIQQNIKAARMLTPLLRDAGGPQ